MSDQPPITLAEQVKEAGREVGMRKAVYPRQVGQGRMSQTEADQRIATMDAIYATLKWLERQDVVVKEVVKAGRADRRFTVEVDIAGNTFLRCACSCADKCPQHRIGNEAGCLIPLVRPEAK